MRSTAGWGRPFRLPRCPHWILPAFLAAVFLLPSPASADLVREVRIAIARNNLPLGESLVAKHRAAGGTTPEMLAALSWLGRGALSARQLEKAESHAAETYRLAQELLRGRALDVEKYLPIAVGAAIEVRAQVMTARGERSSAVEYLRRELEKFRETSIRARIQKNIHLLSLEGKPAPTLETGEWLGPKPVPLKALKGKPVLLFFWAHWCGDCRAMAPVVARIGKEFAASGLVLIGPTQRYGYQARGEETTPEKELRYIDEIRQGHYAELAGVPVPVSEENFKLYGASSTPTLVLLDRRGIVRLYNPGEIEYDKLADIVRTVTEKRPASPKAPPESAN
jgi:thiol-disulfide isomerase/thioredoxin